jgi:ElaB/YqjD/DUF883 family membrane-anchored ribosome-binding protein
MQNKTENGHSVDVDQFMQDLKTVVHDGQELLKAGFGTAKEKATLGARSTDRKVRQYPYQTLGIVFGLGLVAGLMATKLMSGGEEDMDDDY